MQILMENEKLKITIQSRGAELASVIHQETGQQMLWTADSAVWGRHAPLLFPYCGKLKNGTFTHCGTTYEGAGHGFARDLEFTLIEQTPEITKWKLEANALTMERFPFAFSLIVTYQLQEESILQTVTVENQSEEEMPFGLGFHPAFLCPFDEHHKIEDYIIRFEVPETPKKIITGTQDGLVTGEEEVFCDNQQEIALFDEIFEQGSICLSELRSSKISLVEKESGRAIHVGVEGFPYILLWSVPAQIPFICIEPWLSLPDHRQASGVWAEKPAAAVLQQSQQYSVTLKIEFAR